ncbi:MAG: iron-sulfur cluster assembly scaffold protein [Candidatus Lokiarchaeota archaeon]|nr:iron-sulfur cluster assembly scaffold protein [Candidatus Harpocratesius repetitus]
MKKKGLKNEKHLFNSSDSPNHNEDEFDLFVSELQMKIDEENRKDFSKHALELGDNPYHHQIPENSEKMIQGEWRGPCGDSVRWYLDIKNNSQKKPYIKAAYYTTDGCTTTSIASSQTALLVENLTISQARKINDDIVLKALGNFPEKDHHCVTLALTSLNIALDNFEKKINKRV